MKKCIKMYEDKYKNPIATNLDNLNTFLQLLADLNEELELYAIGGTAMLLKNIKETTKDIDFLTADNQEKIRKLFNLAGLKEKDTSKLCNIWYLGKIRIDLFYDEFIFGISLPDDWKDKSEHIKDIGKIRLYILNWHDIIITKIARNEQRDIDDSIGIIKAENIDFGELKERYYKLAEVSVISDYDAKFKALEKEYDTGKTD
ncbi:MAG: DUF6036 family nucleotidyltransferase [Nanoarchaeota archaeon]